MPRGRHATIMILSSIGNTLVLRTIESVGVLSSIEAVGVLGAIKTVWVLHRPSINIRRRYSVGVLRHHAVVIWVICLGCRIALVIHGCVHHVMMILRRILRVVRWDTGVVMSRRAWYHPCGGLMGSVERRHGAGDGRGSVNGGRHGNGHPHSRYYYTWGWLYVLPSRQMATSHPAGLGM